MASRVIGQRKVNAAPPLSSFIQSETPSPCRSHQEWVFPGH